MPKNVQANLWRMVGIRVLETPHDKKVVGHFLAESLKLNPHDRKTRFVNWSLSIGHGFALTVTRMWQHSLNLIRKRPTQRYLRAKRLQKLFGFR